MIVINKKKPCNEEQGFFSQNLSREPIRVQVFKNISPRSSVIPGFTSKFSM